MKTSCSVGLDVLVFSLFLFQDFFFRISHEELSEEDTLLERISCRLLVGFKNGLHCCVRKFLAEGTYRLFSHSSSREGSIEDKLKNRVFSPHIPIG